MRYPKTTGQYYDPSYGKGPYDAPKDHEDEAIPGFFKKIGNIRFTKKNTVGDAELKYERDEDWE